LNATTSIGVAMKTFGADFF